MKTLAKVISVNGILFLIGFILWYVFVSFNLFLHNQFIPVYHWGGTLCLLIYTSIINKRYFKIDFIFRIFISIVLVALFINMTNIIKDNFSSILWDYYRNEENNRNLLRLGQYANDKGNFITVWKLLREKGIYGKEITEGNAEWDSETGYYMRDREKYGKVCYNINGKLYILIDWEQKKIIDIKEVKEMENAVKDYVLKNLNYKNVRAIGRDNDVSCYYDDEKENEQELIFFDIFPQKDKIGFIDFRVKHGS